MMRRVAVSFACLLAAALGGCSSFTELSIRQADTNAAYKAWKVAKWDYYYQGVPFALREHIGRGFRQGFMDTAGGGTGQAPIFPPSYYWGPEYRNQRGSEAIAAWFRGYQDGVLAAEKSGIKDYVPLPTSWAPAYTNDPNSPYNQYNNQYNNGQMPPNNVPGEPIPPGVNPQLLPEPLPGAPPAPPAPPLVPPNVGPQGRQADDGQTPRVLPTPGSAIGSGNGPLIVPEVPPVPSVDAKIVEPKVEGKTKVDAAKTPAADKQTFLPPGSQRPAAYADGPSAWPSRPQSAPRAPIAPTPYPAGEPAAATGPGAWSAWTSLVRPVVAIGPLGR
jgi:hypothetical protein